jgi:hypothetical protein
MNSPVEIIDVDHPDEWPTEFRNAVAELKSQPSLAISNKAVIDQLTGWRLRMFHGSRLFPHEKHWFLDQGLQGRSRQVLETRIELAFEHGCISKDERDELWRSHVYAVPQRGSKESGTIHLLLGTNAFKDPHNDWPHARTWGGEAMRAVDQNASDIWKRLNERSTPSALQCVVEVGPGAKLRCHVDLATVFQKAAAGSTPTLHVICDAGNVPVDAVWQPGDAWYDERPALVGR